MQKKRELMIDAFGDDSGYRQLTLEVDGLLLFVKITLFQ